ncbi:MAG: response regulator [Myxococcales bacterium]
MRRFDDWPLRWKMLALILLVSALPLALTAAVEWRESSRLIESSTDSLLQANAEDVGSDLDFLNEGFQRSVGRIARQPAVIRFSRQRSPGQEQLREVGEVLGVYVGSDDPRLRGVALLDTEGIVRFATDPKMVGNDFGVRRYFRDALHGDLAIPDLVVRSTREEGGTPLLAYAAAIRSGGAVAGVAVVYAGATSMWDMVRQGTGRAGAGSFAVVLDQHGVMLAHGSDAAEVFHPAGRLAVAEIEPMVHEHRFGEATRTLLEQWHPLEGAFERARGEALPTVFYARGNRGANVVAARKLTSVPWTLFYLVPAATIRAPVERLIWRTALANAAVILFALLLGTWLAGRILEPVRALNTAAGRLQHGDLSVRVPDRGRDELGTLGNAFNKMAASLAASQEQLEEMVRRRTEALGAAKDDLERQNAALAVRTAELTERQQRDLTFARTLSALSGPGNLREVVGTALGESEEYLRTLVLVCYRMTDQKLVPVGARGGEASPLRVSGRIAEALTARKPVLLDSLPDDAELRFEAGIAAGRPKSVAIVPLTMGDRDVGVLAAGFANTHTPQQIAFLAELALPLALAIGRHELHEQTERFALQLAQRNEALREQSEQLAGKQTELEQKNTEIGRANQLKSEFLANMSHELRTPLNAVIGFSELMLEEKQKLLPDHVQFVNDILASGKHLLSLINSVLDLAKIEAGRVALELQPLDPAHQIAAACALVSAMAQKKDLEIDQVVKTERTVRADAGKLQQILLNLLSNAIKFSEPRKRVEIGVEDQGEMLRFWVADEGPGIADNVRPELFKPFVQGESPLVKKHEGTGLGLAITRRLVEYQGGEVGVETALGRGSTFWALLPADERKAVGPTAVPAVRSEPKVVNGTPRTPDKPLVLVVEDDAANARLLRFHLEAAGYAVAEAGREHEALELARRLKPQLILLDLILPQGEDGLHVLRDLKKDEQTKQVPVIVVSVVQETRRWRELGVAEWFVKPIDAGKLIESVQRLCPAPEAARVRATVLVVDDHDLNRELARTLLERRGCRVLLARNGQEGTRVAKVEQPDLVLMDLAMPVKDGITAARELKADPETAQIPLIAFTALAMRGDEERARNAGFDGYLTKPLETRALDATLDKFLKGGARA